MRGFVEECMARTNCPMNGHAQKLLASVGNDPKYDPRNKNNQGESSRKLPRRIKHKRKCKGSKKYGKHKKSKKSKKHGKNKKSESSGSEKANGKDKSSGSGSEKNSGSESEE